ncbi:putative glycosyltransferase family 15 [Trypanosoma cruzi]|uniref:Putative glycosyltransferase family 15 n=1 Tax=Trypanosoma cruzi TaxID=5693 RepID=A0A2V2WAA6_TRYCR|nr:putative glycosyltransferase family 15 [Trypanosoma cruzi]
MRLRRAYHPPSSQNETYSTVNGVIRVLAGKNEFFLLLKAFSQLEAHFLAYFSHPVHIFFFFFFFCVCENMLNGMKMAITRLIPSARRVIFEDVARFWRELPDGVTEEKFNAWMRSMPLRKYQGRGYRIMCRFWAGLVCLAIVFFRCLRVLLAARYRFLSNERYFM